MVDNTKDPVLVVVQVTGGNDFMNTVVPYTNGLYYDARTHLAIPQEELLPLNNELAFNPNSKPLKELFDQGRMAIVQGVGYPNSTRSHFRGQDIWQTCVPESIATEGWLGKVIRNIDPKSENPITGVSFGKGLPRALSAKGVTVTSIDDLDNYGLMNKVQEQEYKEKALQAFQQMYARAIGTGPVRDYLGETGINVLKGAELLKPVPAQYSSNVEYADNAIAKALRDVARVHIANMGTRVFYTQHGGYDTHANQNPTHQRLLTELSGSIMDFFQDLRDHNASDNILMLVFTEFGRRVRDNGSGTDHGAGGGSFVIGDHVNGGLYAEYPSLRVDDLENGDLAHSYDFRGLYSSILDDYLNIDPSDIVQGTFEKLPIVA
ncbi:MAG: DUF1501 domain-containing protein [SAR202 cluster bacterium]|nr:DUF1501 domain-containing protein [SAR202 cluster bacterium]